MRSRLLRRAHPCAMYKYKCILSARALVGRRGRGPEAARTWKKEKCFLARQRPGDALACIRTHMYCARLYCAPGVASCAAHSIQAEQKPGPKRVQRRQGRYNILSALYARLTPPLTGTYTFSSASWTPHVRGGITQRTPSPQSAQVSPFSLSWTPAFSRLSGKPGTRA